jgi:hypothetical protein
MRLKNFQEFKLKTDSNYLYLSNVNPDLLLVIILNSPDFDKETLNEIEDIGRQVSQQIRDLWK